MERIASIMLLAICVVGTGYFYMENMDRLAAEEAAAEVAAATAAAEEAAATAAAEVAAAEVAAEEAAATAAAETGMADLLTADGFDADKVIEMISNSDLSAVQQTVLSGAVNAIKDNPALLEATLTRLKEALGQ